MTDPTAAPRNDDPDAPLDPQEPAERPTGDVDTRDDGSLAKVLTRIGANAPDAADIEDPERQL